ncbi:hypothetical protein [Staphylococcus pseudoxylosus]|uniref:hypothetical protein n=1 Tax=Staphylococcus pseudoxylosus TaxID=2282419 RepID=UPI002DB7B753|nr:hypothetical protein [Staphylococcus pseudoxylosus]MEB7753281.1 hypothetical protein [Staphylococcus pseudoxylosus]
MARNEITTPLDLSNLENHNKNYEELYDQIDATDKRLSENMWEEIKDANTIKMLEPVETKTDLPAEANDKSLITVIDEQRVYAYVHDEWQPFSEIDLDPFSPFKEELQDMIKTHETTAHQLLEDMETEHEASVNEVKSLTSDFNTDYQTKMATLSKEYETKLSQLHSDYESYSTQIDKDRTESLSDISSSKSTSIDEINQAKQEALDSVTNENQDNWQKYKLTDDNGSRIYLSKGSFDNVLDLAPGFYETIKDNTKSQGFPDFFAGAPFVEIDVTYGNNGRKQFKVTQSFSSQTAFLYIHTDGENNSGWLEMVTKKTIFEGTVSGENSTFDLYDDPKNYSYLIISGTNGDGEFSCVSDISNNGAFIVKDFGVYASATGAKLYKMILDKTGKDLEYKVTSSVYFGVENGKGDHSQTSKIDKIIGVK